jgi:hypothetical protein
MASTVRTSPLQASPVLAAFLVHDCKYSVEVFSRALLALAEDGRVRIVPSADGGPTQVGLVTPASAEYGAGLDAGLQSTLDRIVIRAGTTGTVPISVLTSDDGDSYKQWRRGFVDALGRLGQRTGLCRRSSGRGTWWLITALIAAAVVAWVVVAVAKPAAGSGAGFGVATVLVLGLLLGWGLRRWRPTPEGLEVAAWWRREGGGLGGTVLGDRPGSGRAPAPGRAELLIAEGRAPLPRGQVWSSAGGRWHPVRVGRVRRQPTWPRAKSLVPPAIYAVVLSVPTVVVAMLPLRGSALALPVAIAPAVLFGLVTLILWVPARAIVMMRPAEAVFTGEVVRRWHRDNPKGGRSVYKLCIDDGVSKVARTYVVSPSLHDRFWPGEPVIVRISPRWRRLTGLEPAPTAGSGQGDDVRDA